jgi:hypothetical protein
MNPLKPLIPRELFDIVVDQNMLAISFEKLMRFNISLNIKTISDSDDDQED